MRSELAKRGPDGSGETTVQAGRFQLTFIGSVLALRGKQVVCQPVQDDHGNVLLWNGEVFGGIEIGPDENDTALLLHLLRECTTPAAVVDLFNRVQGPYAFVYWQAKEKKLFFGKDKLGRRSLLLHRPSSHSDPFILSSVAVYPALPEETQVSENNKRAADDEEEQDDDEEQEAQFWEELHTSSLYYLDFLASDEHVESDHNQMLLSGLSMAHIGQRDLFPFGRRTITEPSDDNAENRDSRFVDEFVEVLKRAVSKRVGNLPVSNTPGSRVGILFSGGLDSIVLARLADLYIPSDESIDLLNVAFAADNSPSKKVVPKKKSNKAKRKGALAAQVESIPASEQTIPSGPYDSVPDRQTGIRGWNELRSISPSRRWNFVEVNVLLSELHEYHNYVMQLLHPSKSLMDHSIAAATWFAARGKGVIRSDASLLGSIGMNSEATARYAGFLESSGHHTHDLIAPLYLEDVTDYISPARILLIGSGADEQFGGYGRHRTAFRKGGWAELQQELEKDVTRLWRRNLGRDDRVISSTGRESRIPYLDEEVIAFLNRTPLWEVCDMRLKPGVGDKALLREAGRRLGLTSSTLLVKRAIQFGSRIAKVSQPAIPGGQRKIKGADGISLSLRPSAPQPQPPSTADSPSVTTEAADSS